MRFSVLLSERFSHILLKKKENDAFSKYVQVGDVDPLERYFHQLAYSRDGHDKRLLFTPEDRQMVFISYSSKEYATALQIRSALETNHIECWMAPESIPAGSDYADEIQAAIENCEAFLLVLSAASQRSKWVRKELDKALDFDKVVLPIHIDESDMVRAFDYRLTDVQRIEAFGHLSEAISKAIARILSLRNAGNSILADDVEDEDGEMTYQDVIAYNKARRIQTAKNAFFFLLALMGVSLVMLAINYLLRGFINDLLNGWFYPNGSGSVEEMASTSPWGSVAVGMLFLLPVVWLLFKGKEIDSPTLKVLSVILLLIETCCFHLLLHVLIVGIVIAVILCILLGFFTS